MFDRERAKNALTGMCFTVSILEHQNISDDDRAKLRENMDYFISEADKLGIPYRIQNEASKAGYDNDLRVVYMSDAMRGVYDLLDKMEALR